MTLRLAFAGFRHAHIMSLYAAAKSRTDIAIVAACEEDAAARAALAAQGVALTHGELRRMLDEVPCDAVAVGDYYGRRGAIVLAALRHGRHVIGDKPLCTSLAELDEIERLARAKNLKVGCMLDMRDLPPFIGARNLIRDGVIGPVHGIHFGGQHPLMWGTRPGWYFEPGKHGGTLNDIAIHAWDGIPWMTGLAFTEITAARTWNAFARQCPHFQDAAQAMLVMDNGCGVLGDVSYFMPDSMGYTLPCYWRCTFFGEKGMLETSATAPQITLGLNGETAPRTVPLPPATPAGYLHAFIADLAGQPLPDALDTASVLKAARLALLVQQAADEQRCHVRV